MLGLKEAIRAREGRFWPLSLKNSRVLLSLQGPESDAEGPGTLTRVTTGKRLEGILLSRPYWMLPATAKDCGGTTSPGCTRVRYTRLAGAQQPRGLPAAAPACATLLADTKRDKSFQTPARKEPASLSHSYHLGRAS